MRFQDLRGRKVKRALLNPHSDGRGGVAYDPAIVFEDGTLVRFVVQETDTGEYGIEPVVFTKEEQS